MPGATRDHHSLEGAVLCWSWRRRTTTWTCSLAPGDPADKGMKELRSYLVEHATPGEWTLDAGSATDRSKEDMALEIVREKVFQRFYDGELGVGASRSSLWAMLGGQSRIRCSESLSNQCTAVSSTWG